MPIKCVPMLYLQKNCNKKLSITLNYYVISYCTYFGKRSRRCSDISANGAAFRQVVRSSEWAKFRNLGRATQ